MCSWKAGNDRSRSPGSSPDTQPRIAAIAGAVIVHRRRGPPVFPLVVVPGVVLFTVALTYATDRFHASAETALAVLAAVAVDALWQRLRPETNRSE